jgi:hypothetical protein
MGILDSIFRRNTFARGIHPPSHKEATAECPIRFLPTPSRVTLPLHQHAGTAADLIVKPREQGSSLDPSAESGTHFTTKLGFDLTRPLQARGKDFNRAPYPVVDPDRFLK